MTNQNNSEINSILLPLLREAVPNIIANDLIGVQPMTSQVGSIFNGHSDFESPEEKLIRESFGGIPKEEIIEILKQARPEMFI